MKEGHEAPAETSRRFRGLALILVMLSFLMLWLPLPAEMTLEAHRLLAVTFLMAGLWVTQAVPLAAASLIPLALFPLLGIMNAEDVSRAYINDTLFLYVGGMVIALGIERWQLHRRIALHLVSVVGVSPRRLVLGFLLTTASLSMWMSNTACTLLMLPIALAMLRTLRERSAAVPMKGIDESEITAAGSDDRSGEERLAVPLLLAIAYAASLGGMTTLVGTPTNSSAAGIYRDQLPAAPEISVASWLMVCGPIGAVYLAITWYVLTRGLPRSTQLDIRLQRELREQLRLLGRASVAERRMLVVFAATGMLWVCRKSLVIGDTKIISGWLPWYQSLVPGLSSGKAAASGGDLISDATVAISIAILLFFLPSGTKESCGRSVPLMDWKTANGLPWDMILLFGGGFALAEAFRVTGLSGWLGQALQEPLQGCSPWVVIAVLCILMTFLTEFTSNVATVNTVMPTLLAMAEPLGIDARLLFIPVTLAASCAFMMPVGTPPNAIVFSTGRISPRQMASYGLILNLVGVPVLTAGAFFIIRPLLGIR